MRYSALWALRNVGEKGQIAIPQITKTLNDTDRSIRASAASTLAKFGTNAASAAPQLVALLKDFNEKDTPEGSPAFQAQMALWNIGQPAVPHLEKALENSNERIRSDAAYVLGRIGDPHSVRLLVRSLEDEDSNVRRVAVQALGDVGSYSTLPSLRRLLTDRDSGVQRAAYEAIFNIQNP